MSAFTDDPRPAAPPATSALPGLAVLASGRGTNFDAIAEAIASGIIPARLVALVTNRSRAPVLERARSRGVPAIHLDPRAFATRDEHDAALARILREHGADYVAHAGYMRILGAAYLNVYQGRAVNVHPSLLPDFPGLDAPGQAIRAGARVSGCTVHLVDAGIDTGPIVAQERVPVLPGDTPETLHARIQEVEHRLFPLAIARLVRGEFAGILPAPGAAASVTTGAPVGKEVQP